MKLTPELKIKREILFKIKSEWFNCEKSIEEAWHWAKENDLHWDAIQEFRSGYDEETKIECDHSRHYESKSVAKQLDDGTWVGWTYWYGGGKHGEPEAVDWMGYAYFLDVKEEEKVVTIRTFTKQN